MRPMGAPMHSPGLSSALGPSLGPIQEPDWQWAANYSKSAPEGMTRRILNPLHTQPWEQEMPRKGDVSDARIPSVVLRSLSCSCACFLYGRGAVDLATAARKHQQVGDKEGPP